MYFVLITHPTKAYINKYKSYCIMEDATIVDAIIPLQFYHNKLQSSTFYFGAIYNSTISYLSEIN